MTPPSRESLDSSYFDRYRLSLPYAEGGPSRRIEDARRFGLPPGWLSLPLTQESLTGVYFYLDRVRVAPILGTSDFSEGTPVAFDRPGSTDFLVYSKRPFAEISAFRRTAGFEIGVTAVRMRSVPLGFLLGLICAVLILSWSLGKGTLPRSLYGLLAAVGLASVSLFASGALRLPAFELALGAQVGAYILPFLLRCLRGLRAFWLAPTEPTPVGGAAILYVAALVVTIPHAILAAFWRPMGAEEDSLFYLFSAARFLRHPSAVPDLIDPGTWTYTGFSLVMALPWTLGVHPMTAYRIMAVLGPSLLIWSVAVPIAVVSRSVKTGVIGCALAALWGGLEGPLWLLAGLKGWLTSGQHMTLPANEYHDPGFLGEYVGPHSELVSYIALPPLYPREAALIPFWLGLALLSRAKRAREFWGAGALFLLSTFFYPHYAAPGVIALIVGLFRLPAKRRGSTLVALLLLGLGLAVVANGLVTAAMGTSLPRNLMNRILWPRNPIAQPSVEFALPRAMSVLAPLAILGALAIRRLRRPDSGESFLRQGLTELTKPTFLAGLAWSLFAAAVWTFRRGTVPDYTWLVTWRAIVAPTLLASSALMARGLAAGRSRIRVTLLLLLPALSPAVFIAGILEWRSHDPRLEKSRERYERFRALGDSWLGGAAIKEPILLEGSPGDGDYLQAALGVWVWNTEKYFARTVTGGPAAADALLAPDSDATLRASLDKGRIGEVWVRSDSPTLPRLRSYLKESESIGPYIRLTAPEGTANAVKPNGDP